MTTDVEVFLEHHGIKGMKWGVRKDEVSSSELNPQTDKETIALKFGDTANKTNFKVPMEKQWGWNSLSPTQKKLAIGFGGAALAIGVGYGVRRFGGKLSDTASAPSDIGMYCNGLAKHWETGVELPPGSTLKRWSTVNETSVKVEGSFFSFKPKDVSHYANLPNRNGLKPTHLVSVKASKGVHAPSGKKTFEIYKTLFDDETIARLGREDILKFSGVRRKLETEQLAKESFWPFSRNWVNGYDSDPDVIRFFSKVKDAGYNSLIDFFDAGNGADTPLRTLTNEGFSILKG